MKVSSWLDVIAGIALTDGAFNGLNKGTCWVIEAITGDTSGPLLLELAACTNQTKRIQTWTSDEELFEKEIVFMYNWI